MVSRQANIKGSEESTWEVEEWEGGREFQHLARMLKVGAKDESFVSMLTDLICAEWEEGRVDLTSGWMLFSFSFSFSFLFPFPRKVICIAVIIEGGLHCWMWWAS